MFIKISDLLNMLVETYPEIFNADELKLIIKFQEAVKQLKDIGAIK